MLPIFETIAPSDARPREAIEDIRLLGLGGPWVSQPRTLAWAANAAGREVGDPARRAKQLAQSVIDTQQAEIGEMEALLQQM